MFNSEQEKPQSRTNVHCLETEINEYDDRADKGENKNRFLSNQRGTVTQIQIAAAAKIASIL
jgi:hypothetical protein